MLRGILLLLVWRKLLTQRKLLFKFCPILTGFTEARNTCDQFTAINDCTCPGYNSLYECTVIMGIATVWKGTAFNCQSAGNEIVLLHNTNFTSLRTETCNSGVISGRIIRANNGIYTSQLVVRVSVEMNGSTVVCAHDTGVNTPVIGSKLLTIVEGRYDMQEQL